MTVSKFGQENYIANGFGIPAHDHIQNVYDGDNLISVEYRLGGSSGEVVAVLSLSYDSIGRLTSVERTL